MVLLTKKHRGVSNDTRLNNKFKLEKKIRDDRKRFSCKCLSKFKTYGERQSGWYGSLKNIQHYPRPSEPTVE